MPRIPTDTAFTRAFGLGLPVVQAPMGGVCTPRFVAAAAEAGALGMLPIWMLPPDAARAAVAELRALTARPVAVNLRADRDQDALIAIAAGEGVDLAHLFWGDPGRAAPAVRRAGARMIATVSDADTAKAALDAGAVGLIAQGAEAGGHVFGTTPLEALLPQVTALAGDTPVAAAGGVTSNAAAARAFALGASAVVLGTRLLVAEESEAHPDYKAALIAASGADTALTLCFDGGWPDAPHRVLRNSTFRAWEAAGSPPAGARPGEGEAIGRDPRGAEIPRYHCSPPRGGVTGEIEAMCLYAGAGVGEITRVQPLRAILDEVMTGA